MSGTLSEPCSKLPIELHTCPTCGAGVKQSRGWTWISPDPLLDPGPHDSREHEAACPLGNRYAWEDKRAGLIWIGAKFYKTPSHFMREAVAMGVSRRISQVPRELVIGETWVALAHPNAVRGECEHGRLTGMACEQCESGFCDAPMRGGVVTFFRPTAIEYIVKGEETEDELDALEARGFTLVKVLRAGEDAELDMLDEQEEDVA